ncbi:hypothetical protein DsansV1_C14g0131451 [Dioscorea sansibarensis]
MKEFHSLRRCLLKQALIFVPSSNASFLLHFIVKDIPGKGNPVVQKIGCKPSIERYEGNLGG